MDALEYRLQTKGVYLRTGEVIYKIRSNVPIVALALHQLYCDFPLIENNDFSDFHLDVRRTLPISKGFRAHTVVRQRGRFETTPFPIGQTVAQFEWGLNRCVYSQYFPRLFLHGSVLEQSGEALIIVGESGAGTSTLSAALCLMGWRLLSDE